MRGSLNGINGFCKFHSPNGEDPLKAYRSSNTQATTPTTSITQKSHHAHVVATASPIGVVVNPETGKDFYEAVHNSVPADFDMDGLRTIYNECNGDGYPMAHKLTDGSVNLDFWRPVAVDGAVTGGIIQSATLLGVECYSRRGILRIHPVTKKLVLDNSAYEQYEDDFRRSKELHSPTGDVIQPVMEENAVGNGKDYSSCFEL